MSVIVPSVVMLNVVTLSVMTSGIRQSDTYHNIVAVTLIDTVFKPNVILQSGILLKVVVPNQWRPLPLSPQQLTEYPVFGISPATFILAY